jgi:probable HAF family extracellular repeat protein
LTAQGSRDTCRRHIRWWLLAPMALVVLVPAAVAAYLVNREPAEPVYLPLAITADGKAIELGIQGMDWGVATDISADGTVVGYAAGTDGATHAFVSGDDKTTDLGATRSAVAINDAGQVLVTNMDPAPSGWQPVLWTDGAARALTSDLGPLYQADDLDEQGRVVGEIVAAPGLYAWPIEDAESLTGPIGVLWEDGRVTLLETADAMLTRTVRIDEAGAVLGQGRVKGSWPNHVLLWRAGSVTDLGMGEPISMNDHGQIVLQKQQDDDPDKPTLSYLWEAGRFTPLSDADGASLRPYDINGAGLVVGQVDDKAAFWQNGRITLLDLHSKNSWVAAVNDAGTMVGTRRE